MRSMPSALSNDTRVEPVTYRPVCRRLYFSVLGPFTVTHGSESVRIPAAKHRAVLGMLLACANSVVSVDQLLDELWGDGQPRSARKTLQGYIWRLRRALPIGDGQLTTSDSGYRLAIATDALDSLEFERLTTTARTHLAAGQRQRGADVLSDAIRLWRGDAFDGVPETMILRAHATMLDEMVLDAFELLVSTQLELGRGRDVLPRLSETAGRYPYRESLHRLLMTALYHDGRPLDALDAFNRFRRRVTEEFGLDPHRDTVRLQQAILRGLPIERTP